MTEREFNSLKAGDKVKHKGSMYIHTLAGVKEEHDAPDLWRFVYFSPKRPVGITNIVLPPAKEHYTNWELVEVAA